jgi:hypothetical protein
MFLCNACEEGETDDLYGICDECAVAIAREAKKPAEALDNAPEN